MRILLVDDSGTTRAIIRQALEAGNYEVEEANDGPAGLAALERDGTVNLVLLDWNMPGMSGLECLKAIRSNPAFAGVRVMMCTTESGIARIAGAIREGANGYLIKPADAETIRAKVATVLSAVRPTSVASM